MEVTDRIADVDDVVAAAAELEEYVELEETEE